MTTKCPGCRVGFSLSGLSKHIALTTNSACLAQGLPELPTAGVALPEVHIPDLDTAPIPFEGDLFGSYGAGDFPEQDGEDLELLPEDLHNPPTPGFPPTSDDEDDDLPEPEGWEPPIRPVPPYQDAPAAPATSQAPSVSPALPTASEREAAARAAGAKTFVVPFPCDTAGAPVEKAPQTTGGYALYQQDLSGQAASNPYAPFASKLDWEMARWAKLRGAGSTAFTDLLTIEGVAEKLALSYKNSRELNNIIDGLPTGRPRFQREEIIVADEAFEVYFRDILECIRALLGDPEFAPLLLLVPERHYADPQHKDRVYFDMNTGKWWWATQAALERERPGATVIPIIISSDKTQLTLIGNKTAYPVYMTLGNLPKDIRCKPSRRGQILLAYLPTTRLLHITNKAARRRTLANLFHACMSRVLQPLESVGVDGMHFSSGDGIVRRGHPILATFVGDYPEQVLVTGCKTGECPKCKVPRDELGNNVTTLAPLRDLAKVLDALAAIDEGALAFTRACREAGIKPLDHPFWEDLPYTNIFVNVTPDILHQLYQGVVKHLVAWLQAAYGPEEIDARCRRLPPNHNLRHFTKGISTLSRVTGKEHQDISRILMGLIIGLQLPGGMSSSRLVRATRALLDFLYLSQYSCHTTKTLTLLDEALAAFHANKGIFVDLGIREHFRLPKLHALEHYRRSIELFGTTDNYDTQYSERLHIDFTKEAYRASNRKDEFAQMTVWLERKEKVQRHEKYVEWRLSQLAPSPTSSARPDSGLRAVECHNLDGGLSTSIPAASDTRVIMSQHPSVKAVAFEDVLSKHGATYFRDALARFVVSFNRPTLSASEVELACGGIYFPFRTVPVFHKIKFALRDIHGLGVTHSVVQDVVHARPARVGKYGAELPARFDTVLVRTSEASDRGAIQGYRVAQVRLVFTVPARAMDALFPRLDITSRPRHLAYVEWFSASSHIAHPDHGLYKVSRSLRRGARLCSVIPVDQIERSCRLFPEFGPVAPRDWTSSNVLETCPSFLLNTFLDRSMYTMIH
ncbi:hypothetical protein BV20DRAFT_988937 [Pilatotrama ljubarskyi]|nr:hypothetical protein BV20DRAFT_988937 [Pilatotrama ljubarskyi]